MLVTDRTRAALSVRREDRDMKKMGYRKHETDWEILRGPMVGGKIVDAKISVDGLHVWTKIEGREKSATTPPLIGIPGGWSEQGVRLIQPEER